MFLVVTFPLLRREPLEVVGPSACVTVGTASGLVYKSSETQAAKPPPVTNLGVGGTVLPGAMPLAADPDPLLLPGAGAYSFPPLILTEPAKEKVTAVATTPLLGPR